MPRRKVSWRRLFQSGYEAHQGQRVGVCVEELECGHRFAVGRAPAAWRRCPFCPRPGAKPAAAHPMVGLKVLDFAFTETEERCTVVLPVLVGDRSVAGRLQVLVQYAPINNLLGDQLARTPVASRADLELDDGYWVPLQRPPETVPIMHLASALSAAARATSGRFSGSVLMAKHFVFLPPEPWRASLWEQAPVLLRP